MTTTSFLRISAAACLAAILFSATAEAQPPRGGGGDEGGGRQRGGQGGQRGGFGGQRGGAPTISKAMLLGIEDVKDELKIDDGQSATLDAAIEAYKEERSQSRPDFSGIREMSEEDRAAFIAKMTKESEVLAKKTDETLNALLEPEQVTRLDQIVFQMKARNLIGMLKSDEAVKKALAITEEQGAKLDEADKANEEAQGKFRDEMRGNGGERPDFEAIRAKMETLRKESDERVMAVLTGTQKTKMEEMKGKPFEIDPRALMRGGFGGGGGRGGQGGPGGGRGGQGGPGGGRGGDGNGGGRQRPPADADPVI